MARRRKKSKRSRSRSRRRNPSRKRRRSSGRRRSRSRGRRRTHSNPHRHKRVKGHRRRRRNPGGLSLSGFSPLSTLKKVGAVAVPFAIGYFGTNLVHGLIKRHLLDRFTATQSAGVQSAIDLAARAVIAVPIVTFLGGKLSRGKGAMVFYGAAGNVVVNVGRAVATNVPGLPETVSATLGDYPGTPGVYNSRGVYGFLKPSNAPASGGGVGNFLAPAAGGGKPVAAAQGGRAFL